MAIYRHTVGMPRLGRVVVPGIPHHVTQRGVRREEVFFSQKDRWRYLEFLAEAAEHFGVAVWSWCLMTNHVHIVAVPEEERSLALCFGKAHTQYTRMINFRKDWRGHLWQARFGSSPMEDGYTYHTVRYVLRNPVRAGLVEVPWEYEWSSAAFHVGEKKTDPLVKPNKYLDDMIGDWRTYLLEPQGTEILRELRKETSVGRPLGSKQFVSQLEQDLSRSLTRRPLGRPKKKVYNE
jgi:putative transposase